VKTIDKNDKMVMEAKRIAESVKILPYPEVERLLDMKASKFNLARSK